MVSVKIRKTPNTIAQKAAGSEDITLGFSHREGRQSQETGCKFAGTAVTKTEPQGALMVKIF